MDLFCIKNGKNKTESKTTEIHILKGDDDYKSFVLHSTTALHETDDNWTYDVGEYNNNGKFNIYVFIKIKQYKNILKFKY